MTLRLNVMAGGEAGQGMQSVGMILAKTMARGGLHIFADQDYESRVRGGSNLTSLWPPTVFLAGWGIRPLPMARTPPLRRRPGSHAAADLAPHWRL